MILKNFAYAQEHQLNFEAVLPPSKTPRERTEILDRLERYFFTFLENKDENYKTTLQTNLLNKDWIEAAWFAPEHELPVDKVTLEAQKQQPKQQTPLFQNRQIYLNEPPVGIGMNHVFNLTGGRGQGVQVVDVEGGWDFDHEDLIGHNGRLVWGAQAPQTAWTDHGSAVLGEISGFLNNFGVTGIASSTKIFGASIYDERGQQTSVARTLIAAADHNARGDLILIELHRGGPRGAFIAMEWWPDNFDAIKYATQKGVIVLEAAGNGNQNLSHPDYNRPQAGFPPEWRNPFNRTLADCGAIMCGAGAPPPGTNGRNWGPDRSRLDFSNYGESPDSQGWGREVTSAGYGDLQRPADGRKRFYTAVFSGTSSASPIVVGAVSAIQGIAKSRGINLGPAEFRALLRKTGSPQTDAPGRPAATNKIGTRPNLQQLLNELNVLGNKN